jgi:hypothetical protein
MIHTSDFMCMAMLSVISAVVGLCRHRPRTMLDGFNGGGNGQRQSKA